jgi:hypothetical protein
LHIGKENSYQLPFTFYRATSSEDLVFEMFRRVGLGLGVVDRRGIFWFSQIVATISAKLIAGKDFRSAFRAKKHEISTTFSAIFFVIRIFSLAGWAFHNILRIGFKPNIDMNREKYL